MLVNSLSWRGLVQRRMKELVGAPAWHHHSKKAKAHTKEAHDHGLDCATERVLKRIKAVSITAIVRQITHHPCKNH